MSNVLTMSASQERARDGVPAPVKDWVDFSDGSGPARVVAYVERELPPGGIPAYLAARSSGARSFVLWANEHRRERVATLVTLSATGGVATFQALGAHGELIGTLVREKALRGRGLRTRWTVTQAGGPEAVGFKGRIFWWCMWWLLLPMQVLIQVFALFDSVPGNEGGGVARAPGASGGARVGRSRWSSDPAATSCICTRRDGTGGSGPRWSSCCAASATARGTPGRSDRSVAPPVACLAEGTAGPDQAQAGI